MLFARIVRAIRLDGRLYEELRQDPIATAQAITMVILATLACFAGGAILAAMNGVSIVRWLPVSLILMPGIWIFPALSLFFLGGLAQVSQPGRGSNRDLIIAAGYSTAPAVLWLLLPIPKATQFVEWFTLMWVMVSIVFAARAILAVSIFKAIVFVAPGIVMSLILFVWLTASLAGPAAGG